MSDKRVRQNLCFPTNVPQFGAVVSGADLNRLDEETFQAMRQAVYTHSVVVIKGQHGLCPARHFEFVSRFDPEANPKHRFGSEKRTKELGSALGV
jgi:alpha-ketoglutarate-dependent taurine dioxygenase